jgi:hypothetical protein
MAERCSLTRITQPVDSAKRPEPAGLNNDARPGANGLSAISQMSAIWFGLQLLVRSLLPLERDRPRHKIRRCGSSRFRPRCGVPVRRDCGAHPPIRSVHADAGRANPSSAAICANVSTTMEA